jgi:hypothetical protein
LWAKRVRKKCAARLNRCASGKAAHPPDVDGGRGFRFGACGVARECYFALAAVSSGMRMTSPARTLAILRRLAVAMVSDETPVRDAI